MRVAGECLDCLKGLAERTLSQIEAPSGLKEQTKALVWRYLEENFYPQFIPFQLATRLQEIIKERTNTRDPFKEFKKRERELARRLFQRLFPLYADDLLKLISLSVLGNALDFFKQEEEVVQEVLKGVSFAIDQRMEFISFLKPRDKVLFLADNAGEVFFDAPLVHKLGKMAQVVYVVKGGPVQNDITLQDLEESGVEFERVITTGLASPGLELGCCSEEFLRELEDSQFIIAKGMGYYEAFCELKLGQKIFYLLKAKCLPIARSLAVPLNSYVAKYVS